MPEKVVYFRGEFDVKTVLSNLDQIQNKLNGLNLNDATMKKYSQEIENIRKKVEQLAPQMERGFSSEAQISKFRDSLNVISQMFNKLAEETQNTKINFDSLKLSPELTEQFNQLKQVIADNEEQAARLKDQYMQFSDVQAGKLSMSFSGEELDDIKQLLISEKSLEEIQKEKNQQLDSQIALREQLINKTKEEKASAEEDLKVANQKVAELKTLIELQKADVDTIGKRLKTKTDKQGNVVSSASSEDVDNYEKASAELEQMRSALSQAETIQKSLSKEVSNYTRDITEANLALQREKQLRQDLNTLLNAFDGKMDGLTDEQKQIVQEILNSRNAWIQVNNQLNTANQQMDNFVESTKTASISGLKEVSNDAEQMGDSFKGLSKDVDLTADSLDNLERKESFFNQLKSRITMVFDLASAFNYANRAINYTFSVIKDLDAAFTEIAVVTDMTTEELWGSFDTYNKMAQELGTTTKDAIQTSALYYQQGLDTAEVMTLTEETIKMARIAGMDFAEATDRMTAALRGFKLEMSEASRVNDVFSALAAESAVDTDELSYALTKTASIAQSAGMELKTTSAFLSQMIETTREAPEQRLAA